MSTNQDHIARVIDYIEEHIKEDLDLDKLAEVAGYSKYHLHRMFTSIVGFTVHGYVQRRKLTEAARHLVFSNQPIVDIAYDAGYETQRSFTAAFKGLFKRSPKAFRKKKEFVPLQLKCEIDRKPHSLRGDKMLRVEIIDNEEILLAGYKANTKRGFFVIGMCWHKLHASKKKFVDRIDEQFAVGLNDYTQSFCYEDKQPAFDYYASVQVRSFDRVQDKKISTKELPPSKYAVFHMRGKNEDSLQPAIEYIYKVWFPQTTYQLNENAKYDFAKYGEFVDEKGESDIQIWIPIL